MQYQKVVLGKLLIELHNSWAGEESVYLNGQLVSKKSSFWGTSHFFTAQEDGRKVNFVLTTKVGANMQVMFDILKNGELAKENVPIPYGSMPKKPHLVLKKSALRHLKEYDLDAALTELNEAAVMCPDDPELYFYMACAYSVMENAREGFQCLQEAVTRGLRNQQKIETHDMLAFLRLHPAFETFKESGFRRIKNAYFKRVKEIDLLV